MDHDPDRDRPSDVQVRPIGRDGSAGFLELDRWAFAFDDSEVDPQPAIDSLDWDRTYGAWIGEPGRLAGVKASHGFELTVPGPVQVPCSGLTWVGVHPQDRRRGVLTAMMRQDLLAIRERGTEPVSALFAAEPAIYGRFGYGLATRHLIYTLGRGAHLRELPDADRLRVRIETADPDRHAAEVEGCRRRLLVLRPGMASRPTVGLQRAALSDQLPYRRGAEALRVIFVDDPGTGEIRGYAIFRRKAAWEPAGPEGSVQVHELLAQDAAAARALWGRLTDLDLMAKTVTDYRPLDDPLNHLLLDVRAAVPRLMDGLWIRLVDVPAALAARRYTVDVDVVLEVTDPLLTDNAGRWRLAGGPDGAECLATDATPDLSLDVRELGAAYLGGETLTALAGAGLVAEHSPGALTRTSIAFTSPVAPFCNWEF